MWWPRRGRVCNTQDLTAQRQRLLERFFNVLATFAEFEIDLLRLRTREGMAIARAKGRLRGRQPTSNVG